MVKDNTLYDILGVQSNSTTEEITKAYKKIAIKWHPDRNPDNIDQANQKLIEINQAKEILTDTEKRRIYDQVGMDYVNNNEQQQQHMNHEDLFNMFNNNDPFQSRQKQKENIFVNHSVTLEEMYNESIITVKFQQKQICKTCDGEGTKDRKTNNCTHCNGKGVNVQIVQMGPMIQQIQIPCTVCNGTGKIINNNNKCSDCSGEGYTINNVSINIPLKNGLSPGQQIQLPGQGHNLKDGKTDLIITINEIPHAKFQRLNNDLLIEVDIKLYQSLFGFDKIIEHLDKRKLLISHVGKTEYKTIKKIVGEGMNILNSKDKGDLLVKFNIILPIIDNIDMSNKLLYLLKTFETEEANNETIIKNSKNNFVKVILKKTDYKTVRNNAQQQQHQQQHQHQHQHQQQQQCVHQ